MGYGFILGWKWVDPIQSSLLSSSSKRPHSPPLRCREASFQFARACTLSVIPGESELPYKDSVRTCTSSFGALQSINAIYMARDKAGSMGVLEGAARFDSTKGYQFSTYVQYWIRKSISGLIAQNSRGIRIPDRLNNVINQMQKARRSFYNLCRRYPKDEELSKLTGVSLANIRMANNCTKVMDSLDRKVAQGTSVKFKEIIPDKSVKTPDESAMAQDMRRQIFDLLSELHQRERHVLALRHGFGDGQSKSLAEIGRLLHVTKECIKKTEKSALSKVRKEEALSSLSYYLEL